MTITRRTALIGATASAGLLAAPFMRRADARSAEFTYKFANNQPLTHPSNIRSAEAAAAILEESGGRVDVQIFPSNQLGSGLID